MKVKELIEELKNYNPEAILTVGDNFYNGIQISIVVAMAEQNQMHILSVLIKKILQKIKKI